MGTKRVVRKIEPAQLITFDDQLWTINAALLVMAGFAAGAIVAVSSFDESSLISNGWARLASLAVSVGLLMGIASFLGQGWIRRSMQFAALVSLIIHCGLMVVLYSQELSYVTVLERREQELPKPDVEVFVLPDYHQKTQPLEAHERPVDVVADENAATQEQSEPARLDEAPTLAEAVPLPSSEPSVEPHRLELAQLEEAAALRSDQTSAYSRRIAEAQLPDQQQVESPQAPSEETFKPVDAQVRVAKHDEPLPLAHASTPTELDNGVLEAILPRQRAKLETIEPRDQPRLERALAKATPVETSADVARSDAQDSSKRPTQLTPSTSEPVRTQSAPSRFVNQPVTTEQIPPAEPALLRPASETAISMRPSAPPDEPLARALRTARVEASPVRADSPAVAEEPDQHRPEAQPQRTALSKGEAGVFGIGDQASFDRGLPGQTQSRLPCQARL